MSPGLRGRSIVRWTMAAVFVGAGIMHVRAPELFAAIVPPGFGPPKLDVLMSGVAEVLGGIGLLIGPLRRPAQIGLATLLLAVWPANWYMALHADRFAHLAPPVVLWARLPLQLVLWWLVWLCGDRPTDAEG